jgi:hypothetical protein
MEKIKDLSRVILPEKAVLAKICKPKRLILSPDGTEDKDSYGEIIAVDKAVTDLKVGDIVIKYGGSMYGYTLNAGKSNETTYAIMHRGNINIAVTPDNFINPDILTESISV